MEQFEMSSVFENLSLMCVQETDGVKYVTLGDQYCERDFRMLVTTEEVWIEAFKANLKKKFELCTAHDEFCETTSFLQWNGSLITEPECKLRVYFMHEVHLEMELWQD